MEITAPLDAATKRRVLRKMLVTGATVALVLIVLGELLRVLLHFTVGSLSMAGGVILLVQAVWMVLAPPGGGDDLTAGKDPMQLAQYPLAVPYLLNPVGIVGLAWARVGSRGRAAHRARPTRSGRRRSEQLAPRQERRRTGGRLGCGHGDRD